MNDTIATLQTPPGRGGIAVILLRGPRTAEVLARVFRPMRSHAEGGAGVLQLGHMVEGEQVVDEAVVHAREPWAEINIHGGPAAVTATLRALAAAGASIPPAAPRGDASFATVHPRWNNPAIGREMLDALADARSPLVVAAVSVQWSDGLSRLVRECIGSLDSGPEGLTQRPKGAKGAEDVEGGDDGATPPDCLPRRSPKGTETGTGGVTPENKRAEFVATLRDLVARHAPMRRLLHPAEVVLVGPPNAGKSTLANALAGREVSIVSEVAGTTRDWVRELALLDGLPVWLTDTAGIWRERGGSPLECGGSPPHSKAAHSQDARSQDAHSPDALSPDALRAEVDAESVRRSRARAGTADLVLLLQPGGPIELPPWLRDARVLRVSTQCDRLPPSDDADAAVSAVTGEGLDELRRRVREALGVAGFDASRGAAFTERQRSLLEAAADALQRGDAGKAQALLVELLEGGDTLRS